MLDIIFIFVNSFLEILCFLAIVAIVNINATLSMAKRFIYTGALAVMAVVMDINSIPFHFIFSIIADIVLFLLLKRPAKAFAGNYIIDLLISIVVLSLFQLITTATLGLFGVDLIENEIILACIMIALLIFLRWLSSQIFIHIFIEKYYTPYRVTIIFAIISILFLSTILINIVTRNNESLFTSNSAGQVYLIILGYLAVNLFFAISVYREKRARDENSLVMLYSEHLQGLVNEQRASNHDVRRHLQIMINMNTTPAGEVMNEELDVYFKTLLNQISHSDDTSIIKDDVLISALLRQDQEYAKQHKIHFDVNIMCLLAEYLNYLSHAELIDILDNLINNAFEETYKLDEENRIVQIDFADYYIEIRNKVSLSFMRRDKDLTEHIFEQGYSTKGAGRGFGLSNVLSIAQKHNIEVKQSMAGGFIVFRLEFRKER